jgi:hypothetical protein
MTYAAKTIPAKHACSTLPAMDRTANPAGNILLSMDRRAKPAEFIKNQKSGFGKKVKI